MIPPALEEIDLTAVLATFREQSEEHGHTPESDAERPLCYFQHELVTRSQYLDIILPGDRQNLDIGYRRAARIAAFALATMRRIRHEQSKGAQDK